MTMSMTAAIKEASKYGSIWGRKNNWTVCVPWRESDPNGPVTEDTTSSYQGALRRLTGSRARIALHLMGKLDFSSAFVVGNILHANRFYENLGRDLRPVVCEAAKAYNNGQ